MSELSKLDALILYKLNQGDVVPDFMIQAMAEHWRGHARLLQAEDDPEKRSKAFRAAIAPMGGKADKFLKSINVDDPLPGELNLDDLGDVLSGITWLWDKWLPNGCLSLLVGDKGVGKSYLALALAKCVIEGRAWPDQTPFTGKPGKVGWCECECGHSALIVRRQLLGIPGTGIVFPGRAEDNVNLDSPDDRARVMMLLTDPDVRLLIIDTLSGSGRDRNENASGEMMGPMGWLAELAQKSNKVVLATHHTRKKSEDRRYQITRLDDCRGSGAITQWPRSVIAVDALDPKNEKHCRVGSIKHNFSDEPDAYGYEIIEGVPVFDLNPPEPMGRKSKKADAKSWLVNYLENNGPTQPVMIEAAAKKAGFSRPTIYRAKDDDIETVTDEKTGKSVWRLNMNLIIPAHET